MSPAWSPTGPAAAKWWAAFALLAVTHYIAAIASGTIGEVAVVTQSIIWLPTGVAIAGTWLLGPLGAAAAACGTAAHRIGVDYDLSIILPESCGSALEAWLGAAVLWRAGLQRGATRLRDVLAMFLCAAMSPLASIAAALLGRSIPDTAFHEMPLLSGWLGWWRMNALGCLTVLPVVCLWPPRRGVAVAWHRLGELGLLAAVALLFLSLVIFAVRPSAAAVSLLHVVLPIALLASLRLGPPAAVTVASLGAVFVAVLTMRGVGPFMALPVDERHVGAQVFLIVTIGVPLVFAALIAEREASVARWSHSEGLRRVLLDVMPDTTCRLTGDGRVIDGHVADGQSGLLAVAAGDRLVDGVPADVRLPLAEAVAAAAAGARPECVELRAGAAGRERTLELRCVPAPGGEVLLVARDITERKAMEAQLQKAQKLEAIGRLAGGVAHDFNNLLTVIAGNAEALRDASAAEPQRREQVDEVLDAAQRGANLTRQLLAFSRQQVLTPEVLDLALVVRQLAALLRRMVGADIMLNIADDGPAWVRADRGQVEQIVMNLAVNARDALPDGGILAIATRRIRLDGAAAGACGMAAGDAVELVVQDDGVGMSAEVRARAFEPFFTTKQPGQGTGLGLATVYGIATQSGGTVNIDSHADVGTTVRVVLPGVAAPPLPATPASPLAAVPTVGRTVLVTEDEPAVRDLLARVLRRAGHEVLVATDGVEAVRVAAGHPGPIHLLVTDVVMPHLSGPTLARRLRTGRPDLQVLFLSGHAREETELLEGSDFLAKPFAGQELLARVATLLARTGGVEGGGSAQD